MKFLAALSVIQTLILIFFGARVMSIDARTDEMAKAAAVSVAAVEAAPAQSGGWEDSSLFMDTASADGATVDEVRQIVREEIDNLSARMTAENHRPSGTEQNRTAHAITPEEAVSLNASLQQDLTYYIGRGKISEGEMANLQQKIARLPPEQRGAALGQLTKAMNDGVLEGQL